MSLVAEAVFGVPMLTMMFVSIHSRLHMPAGSARRFYAS
jgi:hypothetical protein